MHSLVCLAENLFRRRRIAHVHMVHGGAQESLSYGQKRRLNDRGVVLVAVSEYVRTRPNREWRLAAANRGHRKLSDGRTRIQRAAERERSLIPVLPG